MILVLIMRSYPQIIVLGLTSDREGYGLCKKVWTLRIPKVGMDRIISFKGASPSGSPDPSKSRCRSSLESQI